MAFKLHSPLFRAPDSGQESGSHRKKAMRFRETDVAGVRVIDPVAHEDRRGRFMRAWCAREFLEHGLRFVPVQANMGLSLKRGTVRGMHFQDAPAPEAKLVRCTRGSVFDVALDLRPDSPSCGKWSGAELSALNGRMMYVPEGCAHGCQSLEDNTEIYYMTSEFYTPKAVRGVRFDDPAFAIRWPLEASEVSEQDRAWPLAEAAKLRS
jgi:dTDP-4-dehydrorhamnose 3,5-epimerase